MNKVLVVEDEKLIRLGIVAMMKRIPVPIEEILLARNGEEAYKIVKEQEIDLMITDIRMPIMDGITLIKKVQYLKKVPLIVVISGYDDFSYAVEVLRHGVRDYLLKPIERNKLEELLNKLDVEITIEKESMVMEEKIGCQQLKYLLLNEQVSEEERDSIERMATSLVPENEFVVCCFSIQCHVGIKERGITILTDVENNQLMIVTPSDLEHIIPCISPATCIGVSKVHTRISELRKAYEEAFFARKEAFVRCMPICHYKEIKKEYEHIPENFATHFVQLIATPRADDVMNRFANVRLKAKVNKISSEQMLSVTSSILDSLFETFGKVIEMDLEQYNQLQRPLHYHDGKSYYEKFEECVRLTGQIILQEFETHKNKEKINAAIQYIKKNYKNDLNMAVVSNYISMNYSLFSLDFKQYTGMNFVNYLKQIRMEEAKRLLRETDEKIIDISKMVGYENEKHFMKLFKTECGVSPSEFRKNIALSKR